MTTLIRAITRVRDADDTTAPAAADDHRPVVWDETAGKYRADTSPRVRHLGRDVVDLSPGATATLDLSAADVFRLDLSQNTEIVLTNPPPSGVYRRISIRIEMPDPSVGVVWPGAFRFDVPVVPAGKAAWVEAITTDGGASWEPVSGAVREPVFTDILAQESFSLEDMYEATGGANWTNNTGWDGPLAAQAHGIVNITGGRVTYIDLGTNNLSGSFAVPALRNLLQMRCRQNSLTSVDTSGNPALTQLWAQSNQLTSLDLSANSALSILYCHLNQLTSLDPSANTNLTLLWCHTNPLIQTLDLSANTKITNLLAYSIGANQAAVNAIVDALYDHAPGWTPATANIQIGGTNAAPSGIYQAADPVTTALEKIYDMVEDPGNKFTPTISVSYTAP